MGYVDLGEGRVEARLSAEPGSLRIGTPVKLVLEPVWEADGAPVVTFAFTPEEGAA